MRRTATAHQKEKKNKSIAIYIQVEMPFLDQRWEQKKKTNIIEFTIFVVGSIKLVK